MGPISTGLGEVLMYTIEFEHPGGKEAPKGNAVGWQSDGSFVTERGDRLDSDVAKAAYLRTIQDWVVAPLMRSVDGVAGVDSIGGFRKQYLVQPDPARMTGYGLSFDEVIEALEETFQVGRESGCGVHVSHHKCAGLANHGKSEITLRMIDEAMKHQDVGLDTTPWVASSTILDSGRHKQATRVIVAESEPYPELAGRDLDDIARQWNTDIDDAMQRLLPATGIFFIMDEEDVQRIMSYEHTMICSDGIPSGTHPHPRVWGTFPRVLGRYARDVGLFTMEEAVRRMTSMPADRFGLGGRGRISVGCFADLVIFDPATIEEGATFESPIAPAKGIDRVIVNGRDVWVDGAKTGARPGRPLEQSAPVMVV